MISTLPLLLCLPAFAAPPSGASPGNDGRAVAISVDGTLLAGGFTGGRVALFEASSGKRVSDLDPPLGSVPWKLAFAPDGKRLAGLDQAGGLVIWDLRDEEEGGDSTPSEAAPPALPKDGSIGGWPFGALLAWSPTGERLVVVDRRGHTSLWTGAGVRVRAWKSEITPSGDPQALWSLDGETLLTVDGALVQRRDGKSGAVHSGENAPPEIRCPSPVASMDLHPGGVLLATGHEDCRLKLWNLETGELRGETHFVDPFIHEAEDDIADLAFSPSGDRLAFSTREGTHVLVHDTESLDRLWISEYLGAHFFEVVQICWSPDGGRLWFAFECGGATLRSVDPREGAKPEEHGDGLVPLFGGSTGIVLSSGEVHAIDQNGLRLW